ncbi:hypothetical protein, variant [Sphaeroforma arctica JP610]|uniref:Mut7-C RNAse domain-containing protein n=1 Tax=Sphaeroforma arctica JP610 TaxID=667725 RepID=A0A0L0FR87_9EUKA|nr:hypothetical protein, variant [Sphaeroforma arctica JP610]KNC79332.1 hypothetical protein, variant [Sphaeroforma arctica JP610]|eukprot:XP_014153234.1 hypothetical protein, variant [Sphaeroforma arctica JP610]
MWMCLACLSFIYKSRRIRGRICMLQPVNSLLCAPPRSEMQFTESGGDHLWVDALGNPKFVCDAQSEGLAKQLRSVGIDAAFIGDDEFFASFVANKSRRCCEMGFNVAQKQYARSATSNENKANCLSTNRMRNNSAACSSASEASAMDADYIPTQVQVQASDHAHTYIQIQPNVPSHIRSHTPISPNARAQELTPLHTQPNPNTHEQTYTHTHTHAHTHTHPPTHTHTQTNKSEGVRTTTLPDGHVAAHTHSNGPQHTTACMNVNGRMPKIRNRKNGTYEHAPLPVPVVPAKGRTKHSIADKHRVGVYTWRCLLAVAAREGRIILTQHKGVANACHAAVLSDVRARVDGEGSVPLVPKCESDTKAGRGIGGQNNGSVVYYVRADNKIQQRKEIVTAYGLCIRDDMLLTRCLNCNGEFEGPLQAREVVDDLPCHRVLETPGRAYYRCTGTCRSASWYGSQFAFHVRKLKREGVAPTNSEVT